MDIQKFYEDHQKFMIKILSKFKDKGERPIGYTEKEKYYSFKDASIVITPHTNTYENPPHKHDFFELIYIHRGSCTNIVDSVPVSMKQGDICLMNTNAMHQIKLNNIKQDIVFNLLVKKSIMDSFHFKIYSSNDFVTNFFLKSIDKQRQEKNYILFSNNGETEQTDFFCKIIQEQFSKKIYKSPKISYLFDCFMIELIRSYQSTVDQSHMKNKQEDTFSKMLEYIEQNSATVTLDELGKKYGYHPQHLSKLIKQYSGSSFQTLLTDIRLQQACLLLKENKLSISAIIQKLGYSNRTWFHKLFQEKYHVTPGEYREQQLKTQNQNNKSF